MTKRKRGGGRPIAPPTPREEWQDAALWHPDQGGIFTICARRGCGNVFYAKPTRRPCKYCSRKCEASARNRRYYVRHPKPKETT